MKVPSKPQSTLELQKLRENVENARFESFKLFLEEYSLYRKRKSVFDKHKFDFDNFVMKPLQLPCLNCKMNTTHAYTEDKSDVKFTPMALTRGGGTTSNVRSVEGKSLKLTYSCQRCQSSKYVFQVTFENEKMFKSGQHPSQEIVISPDIDQKLGAELAKHYKKGKICEAHGMGIGAMAYYRRVIEDKVVDILQEIKTLLPEDQREVYAAEIDKVLDLHSFEIKAELIYSLMPSNLKPEGQNLIKLLFSAVSEGLHSNSDEECLEIAVHTSRLLELIITVLNTHARTSKELASIGKLLQKKQGEKD